MSGEVSVSLYCPVTKRYLTVWFEVGTLMIFCPDCGEEVSTKPRHRDKDET